MPVFEQSWKPVGFDLCDLCDVFQQTRRKMICCYDHNATIRNLLLVTPEKQGQAFCIWRFLSYRPQVSAATRLQIDVEIGPLTLEHPAGTA